MISRTVEEGSEEQQQQEQQEETPLPQPGHGLVLSTPFSVDKGANGMVLGQRKRHFGQSGLGFWLLA